MCIGELEKDWGGSPMAEHFLEITHCALSPLTSVMSKSVSGTSSLLTKSFSLSGAKWSAKRDWAGKGCDRTLRVQYCSYDLASALHWRSRTVCVYVLYFSTNSAHTCTQALHSPTVTQIASRLSVLILPYQPDSVNKEWRKGSGSVNHLGWKICLK